MVVEDDARVRAVSAAALRELGYTVIEAADGAEALRIIAGGGIGAGVYASAQEAVAVRPTTERIDPNVDAHGREATYARWLDAIPRVR